MISQRLGCRPSIPDSRDILFAFSAGAATAPPSCDISANVDHVFDQLDIGSCVSNASISSMKLARKKAALPHEELSRLELYYLARAQEGTTGSDAGSTIRDAFRVMRGLGVAPEADWPYKPEDIFKKPSQKAQHDGKAYKINTFHSVAPLRNTLRSAIAAGHGVVVGVVVYESFEQAVSNGGNIPMPHDGEKVLGGHAMLAVGYNTPGHPLKVKLLNSWGTGVGDHGYFYIDENYLLTPDYCFERWAIDLV